MSPKERFDEEVELKGFPDLDDEYDQDDEEQMDTQGNIPPLPWTFTSDGPDSGGSWVDADGNDVTDSFSPEWFVEVTRRVNLHDEMLAMLKEMVAEFDLADVPSPFGGQIRAQAAAVALIRKAEGESA